MPTRWHLVTGEYVPAVGGVALFTHVLARALAAQGIEAHVWTPDVGVPEPGVEVHALPDQFGRGSRRVLARMLAGWPDDTIVVQYTPNAFGLKGANVPFCLWLAARMRRGADIRIVFHEPFFYFGAQSIARNALAATHRIMAAALLSSAKAVYLSSPSWRRLLEPYALGRRIEWASIPITIGETPAPEPGAVDGIRTAIGGGPIVGHLSGYGAEMRPHLRAGLSAVLADVPHAAVLCIGRGSREFARELDDARVRATGELPARAIAAHVAACDVMIAPFDEGITMRRTSVLAALAAGVAVVATDGRHTEPMWRESGAVTLVPAGNPRALAEACASLLASPVERRALAARGRALYQTRFSSAALLAALHCNRPEHAPAHHPGR